MLNVLMARQGAVRFGRNASTVGVASTTVLMVHSGYGSRGGERGCLGCSWDDGDHVHERQRWGAVSASVSRAALWRALGMAETKWARAFSMVQCLAGVEGWTGGGGGRWR